MRQQFMASTEKKRPMVDVAEPTVRLYREPPGVLVVDDDHLVRVLAQMGLERDGFEVWLAANGREAIDLYRTHRKDISVVLLDVCMPDLDGPHTLDALRTLRSGGPLNARLAFRSRTAAAGAE